MSISRLMQKAAAGAGEDAVLAEAVDFDGTNDYLSRSTDLVGNADGKTFTLSAWFYTYELESGQYLYYDGNDNAFLIDIDDFGQSLDINMRNASGALLLRGQLSIDLLSLFTFHHLVVSVDLTNTSNRFVFIDDKDATSDVSWTTYTNGIIDFTAASYGIGATPGGSAKFKGRLSNVFLDYTYRDLSVEANRRLFVDYDETGGLVPADGQASLNPILYLPMDDPEDPGRNDGTGGNFTLNGTVARSGRGPNQYNAAASTFNGSNDYLSRTSLTGASDGKEFTISFSIKFDAITSSAQYVYSHDRNTFYFRIDKDEIIIVAQNSAENDVLYGTGEVFPGRFFAGIWYTFALSVDMTDTNKRYASVDGEQLPMNWSTYNNDTIDFTRSEYGVGRNQNNNSDYVNGEISDFYLDTTYIDLSADNPFYDVETGKPKFLGENGELPTGSIPLIYLPLRADDAGNNKGTGGDFTVNSGPYVGARGPSEFWGESAEFNGTDQYLNRTSALVGGADHSVFSIAASVYIDSTSGSSGILHTGDGTNHGLSIFRNGTGLEIQGYDDTNSLILDATTGNSGAVFSTNQWFNIIISYDRANASNRYIYINGVDYSNYPKSTNWQSGTGSELIQGDDVNQCVGATDTGSGFYQYFDGKIGFLWFNTEYIDFSQEVNRLKFFDAFNYPVDVGEDGSLPTGNQPLIYMNKDFHLGTNLGSGGDFTPANGPTDGGYVRG